jgi:hypothetical protein
MRFPFGGLSAARSTRSRSICLLAIIRTYIIGGCVGNYVGKVAKDPIGFRQRPIPMNAKGFCVAHYQKRSRNSTASVPLSPAFLSFNQWVAGSNPAGLTRIPITGNGLQSLSAPGHLIVLHSFYIFTL